MTAFRTMLALILLAGFYVLTVLLLVAAAVVLLFPLVAALLAGQAPATMSGLIVAFVPVLAALVLGFLIDPSPEPYDVVGVSREQAPGLWALVDDVAQRLSSRSPDYLYLSPHVAAAVHQDREGRHLHIGAPLLAGLTRSELRAILAHEMGHYAGRHTLFGTIIYRGDIRLATICRRLELTSAHHTFASWSAGFYLRLLAGYRWLYRLASQSVRRRQEYEADAAAVMVAGRAAVDRSLRSTAALQQMWSWLHEDFVEPVLRRGYRPADLYRVFADLLADPGNADRLANLRAHPPDESASALDSHPPLRLRLARIAACSAGPETEDRVPLLVRATTSFDGPATVPDEAPPSIRPGGGSDGPASASEAVPSMDQLTARLARPASDPGETPLLADPDGILQVAQRKGIGGDRWHSTLPLDHQLWCRVVAETSMLDTVRRAGRQCRGPLGDVLSLLARDNAVFNEPVVLALAGQALAARGYGEWEFSWTGRHRFAGRCGELVETTANSLHDPAAMVRLRRLLSAAGIDLGCPVDLSPQITPEDRPPPAPAPRPATLEEDRQRSVHRMILLVIVLVIVPVSILCTAAKYLP